MNSELDGLDLRDVVNGRHPWLQQAAAQQTDAAKLGGLPQAAKPRTWQHALAALSPAGSEAEAWDQARRLREATYTPGGNKQPDELAGVNAAARVPNAAQPEAGEMDANGEVRGGQASFFGPLMPQPTGTTNNVGVPSGPIAARHPFGAPLGLTEPAPITADALISALAALPHAQRPPIRRTKV